MSVSLSLEQIMSPRGLGLPVAEPLRVAFAGELSAEDLARREAPPTAGQPTLKAIRAVHHQVARMLALGSSTEETSLVTGLTPVRISSLKSDPAFQDLMSFYAAREDERFVDVQERMVALGISAAEILHERMLEDPDSLTANELRELLKAALDRGGYAPLQRRQEIKAVLTGDDIERLKAETLPAGKILPKDSIARVGGPGNRAAGADAEAAAGEPREGEVL